MKTLGGAITSVRKSGIVPKNLRPCTSPEILLCRYRTQVLILPIPYYHDPAISYATFSNRLAFPFQFSCTPLFLKDRNSRSASSSDTMMTMFRTSFNDVTRVC